MTSGSINISPLRGETLESTCSAPRTLAFYMICHSRGQNKSAVYFQSVIPSEHSEEIQTQYDLLHV